MLLTLVLSCVASLLAILPALFGVLALTRLIHTQRARPPYESKVWQGWAIGGLAGFLVALSVFLIAESIRRLSGGAYESNVAFLWAFYVIEFIFFGGVAGAWTHRKVNQKFLEDSVNNAG
jgi:hypothetical protein